DDLFTQLGDTDQMFLFLAPEQLANDETLAFLKGLEPPLLVIDEAHCISDWGHDFRPDYLRLGAFIEELGHPTTLALTATAAGPVRDEIDEHLNKIEPNIFDRDFDRPNIRLDVQTFSETVDKLAAALEYATGHKGSGII